MCTSSLTAQAAALKAELVMRSPRVETLKGMFDEIAEIVGERHLKSKLMHETDLMEQIVALAHA